MRIFARHDILTLLTTAINGLVDLPNLASVEMEVEEHVTVYRIFVHKDDIKNITGKGEVLHLALEVLARAMAERASLSIMLRLEQ